jgi:hypothetical protein
MRFLRGLRGREGTGDRPPAPFVVGVARSGTTLLRLMLDAHPDLTIPPETHFIPKVIEACGSDGDARERVLELLTNHRRWADFGLDPAEFRRRVEGLPEPLDPGEVLRTFYGLYAEQQAKPRWGDKSPSYVRKLPKVARALPEAHFIHLIRDGRDVALSQMEVHHGAAEAREAAEGWVGAITKARRQAKRVPHYLELRYEDLVDDAEPVLRRVCDFIDLRFDPAMLEYHRGASKRMAETTRDFERGKGPAIPAEVRAKQHERVAAPPQKDRAGRWRTDMSAEDRASFEEVAGELLADLGYEVTDAAAAPSD